MYFLFLPHLDIRGLNTAWLFFKIISTKIIEDRIKIFSLMNIHLHRLQGYFSEQKIHWNLNKKSFITYINAWHFQISLPFMTSKDGECPLWYHRTVKVTVRPVQLHHECKKWLLPAGVDFYKASTLTWKLSPILQRGLEANAFIFGNV